MARAIQFRYVHVQEGIDAAEARRIVTAILSSRTAFGGVEEPVFEGFQWIVFLTFGFGVERLDGPVRVDARPGAVPLNGGGTYEGYWSVRWRLLREAFSDPADD